MQKVHTGLAALLIKTLSMALSLFVLRRVPKRIYEDFVWSF